MLMQNLNALNITQLHQLIFAVIFVMLASTTSAEHDKTDVVTLYNGDRITGEIIGMTAGKLEINPSYGDSMFLYWQEIAQLDSRYNFDLRLDTGERLFGNISKQDRNGYLQFTSIDSLREVALLEVVDLRPIEDTIEDRLDLRFDTTFYADPTTRTTSLTAEAAYESAGNRSSIKAITRNNFRETTDEGVTNTDTETSINIDLQHQRWTNRAKIYRLVTSNYSANDALGNEGRVTIGAGLGRYFIDRAGSQLSGALGAQVVNEKRPSEMGETDSVSSNQEVEAFMTGRWHLYRFSNLDMDILLEANIYPSLSDIGRNRGNIQLNLDWELFDDLYWTVQLWTEVDSGAEDDANSIDRSFDYTVTTGISWRP